MKGGVNQGYIYFQSPCLQGRERPSSGAAGGGDRCVQKNDLSDRSGARSQYDAGDSVSAGYIF